MARPTALTSELEKKFFLAIRHGLSYERCCAFGGIAFKTFRNWFYRSEKGEEPFFQFFQELKKYQHAGEIAALSAIRKAGEGEEVTIIREVEELRISKDANGKVESRMVIVSRTTETRRSKSWQASAWLLERRFPEVYGRVDRFDVPPDGGLGNEAISPYVIVIPPKDIPKMAEFEDVTDDMNLLTDGNGEK